MERPIRKILISRLFEKNFERLPKRVQSLAEKKEILFREDAFHPLLRTHQLGSEFKGTWAYLVNQQYRVHFYFIDDHSVMYVDIGTHEIYK
jgi:mRNA-degrading endonuclease YafQ of YafQ-DinJ toxin-antitoxin module